MSQTTLKLMEIHLSHPLEFWNYRYESLSLEDFPILNVYHRLIIRYIKYYTDLFSFNLFIKYHSYLHKVPKYCLARSTTCHIEAKLKHIYLNAVMVCI